MYFQIANTHIFPALLLATASFFSPSYATCSPSGPLLPRPLTLSTSPAVQNVTANLTALLDGALQKDSSLKVPWAKTNVSFSIAVVSLPPHSSSLQYNTSTINLADPIWEYHQLASLNTNGTKSVDGESRYLIGSISKVFTDLLLLKTLGGRLDEPITRFLPELVDVSRSDSGESVIQWENITLGSLGDHLAGIPATCK